MIRRPPRSTLFPYTTLFRSRVSVIAADGTVLEPYVAPRLTRLPLVVGRGAETKAKEFLALIDRYPAIDRKSTRLNSSHVRISYAVFCLNNKHQSAHTASVCT